MSLSGPEGVVLGADRAQLHLRRQVDADGRVRAECASRPIETALYLKLLEDAGLAPDTRTRLEAVCVRYVNGSSPARNTGTAVDLSVVFTDLIVRSVLGEAPISAMSRLKDALASFPHRSSGRKDTLFSVLLAEVGAVQFQELSLRRESFDFADGHHWARLMMTAAKVIYGVGTADPTLVSEGDLDVIERAQSANGSWENHILLTLVILIALRRSGRISESFTRGVDFLERRLTPDGGVPFVPDIDIWLTALTGFLFSSRGVLPGIRRRMAAYIVRVQHRDGGWGFSEEVRESDVDDAALCVLFLRSHGARAHVGTIRTGERFVLGFQNPDGGFPTYMAGAASEVEVTAHVAMALAGEERHRQAVDRACRWMIENQEPDGSFSYEWTLSAYYPLSQVLWAFRMLDRPGYEVDVLESRACDFMLRSQNADGGWGQLPGLRSSVLSTAYALIGLGSCHPTEDRQVAVSRGCRYLLERQHPTGELSSAPDALGPRPLVYDVRLFSTVYPYWALSAFGPGPRAAEVTGASSSRRAARTV